MSDLEHAIKSIQDDELRVLKAEQYADNAQPEVFASARLKRILERTGRKFRVNWARVVIQSVLNRLELSSVTSGNDETDEIISDIWEYNELGIEAKTFMDKALTLGECYALLWPGEDPEDEDTEVDVDIILCSPLTSKMFYDIENTRVKLYFAQMWEQQMLVGPTDAVQKRVRVNLIYDDRIEKYVSKTETGTKDEHFDPYVDSFMEETDDSGQVREVEQWPVPHEFGEVPAFHFRTQKPYGRPEHLDAYGPQDMLNKLTATQMATNDFQGFPQRYALTGRNPKNESSFEADFEGDPADGDSALVDSDDKVDASGEMTSGPGEVWLLSADKVGEFKAADPEVFLKPMTTYIRAMATTTGTPLHHFEGQGGAPSGESLRVSESPLIKKVGDRQKMFGTTWRDIFRFSLKLRGVEDVTLTIGWAPAQSQDDLEGWQLVQAKIDAGMPLKQALVEHGYTPEAADAMIVAAQKEAEQAA